MKIIGYVSPDGRSFMEPRTYAATADARPELVQGWQPVVLAEPLQPLVDGLRHIAEHAQLPYNEDMGFCWSVGGEVQDWAADLLQKAGLTL